MRRVKPFSFLNGNYLSIYALFLVSVLSGCGAKTETSEAPDDLRPAESPKQRSPDSDTSLAKRKTILFFGNSLTAGYGVEPTQAFPALVGREIDSAGLDYRVVNAGLSGETTAGGKSRIGWVLRQPVDVFVLELGGNDGLRGIQLVSTKRNLQAIIDTVRRKSPQAKIVIAGMQIPPNMGPEYTTRFRQIFGELATENRAVLIPFLLEGVGGVPRLNQSDGIHPTPQGHRLVARTVWNVLEPVLREESEHAE
ncbi:MAG: arylesterase [Cytophagaceae bacterium]|nr:arylesterase [Cytophagaceae bacterium]